LSPIIHDSCFDDEEEEKCTETFTKNSTKELRVF
jgi:hypothetical protein